MTMAARTRQAQFDPLAMMDAMSPAGHAQRAARVAADALAELAAMDTGELALGAGTSWWRGSWTGQRRRWRY
jgi:hypothetical protein